MIEEVNMNRAGNGRQRLAAGAMQGERSALSPARRRRVDLRRFLVAPHVGTRLRDLQVVPRNPARGAESVRGAAAAAHGEGSVMPLDITV